MNYSAAAFLANTSCRAISVVYESDDTKPFTYKSFDASIKKDDLVLVPTKTRHGMAVCKVVAVDVDVDYDSQAIEYKWIIEKVSTAEYDRVLKLEEEAIADIRSADIRSKREELAAKLMKDNPGLGSLQLATLSVTDQAPST